MAMKGPKSAAWEAAEQKEVNNMLKHEVWVERSRRPNNLPILSMWAYCQKLGLENQVVEYKVRICAQGFCQTLGINFEQTYAPTGKAALLCVLLLFALNKGLLIHKLDVRSAYLTCLLEEKVTLLPPPGFQCATGTVLELRKATYGLKQALEAWYKRLRDFLNSIGFQATVADLCVFH
jgi:hypothetical protein